jgi:curved DNA-binding protein CbpA
MSKFLEKDYDNLIVINYYNVLDIEQEATQSEIKKAYMKLAKKHHPDHGGNVVLFEKVTNAYEILSNKSAKKEYDLKLSNKEDDSVIDNYAKLRSDFQTYQTSIEKPMNEQQINAMYDDMFKQIKDEEYDEETLKIKMNDVKMERETVDIETQDPANLDTFNNIMKMNDDLDDGNKISTDDILNFMSGKQQNNSQNELSTNTFSSYDTLGGYFGNDCSLFMNDNNFLGSSTYGNINDVSSLTQNSMKDIKTEDILEWKKKNKMDDKLSNNEIDDFMKKRELEEKEIYGEITKTLKENIKETKDYLKITNINDEINFNDFGGEINKNKSKIVEEVTLSNNDYGDYFS